MIYPVQWNQHVEPGRIRLTSGIAHSLACRKQDRRYSAASEHRPSGSIRRCRYPYVDETNIGIQSQSAAVCVEHAAHQCINASRASEAFGDPRPPLALACLGTEFERRRVGVVRRSLANTYISKSVSSECEAERLDPSLDINQRLVDRPHDIVIPTFTCGVCHTFHG